MSYETDLARVQGLGSAKHGTGEWWMQRMTSIILAVLAPFFIWTLAGALGSSYEDMRETYASPFNSIVAAAFVITALYHLALGNRVVIEDYIHAKGLRVALLVANAGFCLALGFTGLFSIFKLALG